MDEPTENCASWCVSLTARHVRPRAATGAETLRPALPCLDRHVPSAICVWRRPRPVPSAAPLDHGTGGPKESAAPGSLTRAHTRATVRTRLAHPCPCPCPRPARTRPVTMSDPVAAAPLVTTAQHTGPSANPGPSGNTADVLASPAAPPPCVSSPQARPYAPANQPVAPPPPAAHPCAWAGRGEAPQYAFCRVPRPAPRNR